MKNGQWKLRVICKQLSDTSAVWKDLQQTFPSATFEVRETSVVIKLPPENISCPTSFAVVGSGGHAIFKRMQAVVFGRKPEKLRKDYIIKVYLIDDDQNALKVSWNNIIYHKIPIG